MCSATQGSLGAFAAANVVEANTCDYRAQLKSLAGCPTTCITGNSLCSGAGVCGYNTDAKRVQCFCNSGYSGAQCGTHTSSPKGMSAEGIILIIACIVLAGVLGLIGYMYLRLRKLNVDPSAYGDLQGKCAWPGREVWGPFCRFLLTPSLSLSSHLAHTFPYSNLTPHSSHPSLQTMS